MKECALHGGAPVGATLTEGYVGIHKYVNGGQWFVEPPVGRPDRRCLSDLVSQAEAARAKRLRALRSRRAGVSVGWPGSGERVRPGRRTVVHIIMDGGKRLLMVRRGVPATQALVCHVADSF